MRKIALGLALVGLVTSIAAQAAGMPIYMRETLNKKGFYGGNGNGDWSSLPPIPPLPEAPEKPNDDTCPAFLRGVGAHFVGLAGQTARYIESREDFGAQNVDVSPCSQWVEPRFWSNNSGYTFSTSLNVCNKINQQLGRPLSLDLMADESCGKYYSTHYYGVNLSKAQAPRKLELFRKNRSLVRSLIMNRNPVPSNYADFNIPSIDWMKNAVGSNSRGGIYWLEGGYGVYTRWEIRGDACNNIRTANGRPLLPTDQGMNFAAPEDCGYYYGYNTYSFRVDDVLLPRILESFKDGEPAGYGSKASGITWNGYKVDMISVSNGLCHAIQNHFGIPLNSNMVFGTWKEGCGNYYGNKWYRVTDSWQIIPTW